LVESICRSGLNPGESISRGGLHPGRVYFQGESASRESTFRGSLHPGRIYFQGWPASVRVSLRRTICLNVLDAQHTELSVYAQLEICRSCSPYVLVMTSAVFIYIFV
jgi:hypothetical protein